MFSRLFIKLKEIFKKIIFSKFVILLTYSSFLLLFLLYSYILFIDTSQNFFLKIIAFIFILFTILNFKENYKTLFSFLKKKRKKTVFEDNLIKQNKDLELLISDLASENSQLKKEKLSKETIDMKEGFSSIKNEFHEEEKTWLYVTLIFIFLAIFINLMIPIYSSFNFFTNLYSFIPLNLVLFSTIYFSILQYSKFRNLMVENLNKIAIIDGYLGLIKMKKDVEIKLFLPNISNVLFSKIDNGKEKNLPIDEISKISNLIKNLK
jgi:hypothetical protein